MPFTANKQLTSGNTVHVRVTVKSCGAELRVWYVREPSAQDREEADAMLRAAFDSIREVTEPSEQ